MFQAIERHNLSKTNFTDWAVLASPRFLARAALAGKFFIFNWRTN